MKLLSENPEFEEMQQICDMRLHFNITMTSRIGQREAVHVFFVCVWCARKVSYDTKTLLKMQITTNKGTARKSLK